MGAVHRPRGVHHRHEDIWGIRAAERTSKKIWFRTTPRGSRCQAFARKGLTILTSLANVFLAAATGEATQRVRPTLLLPVEQQLPSYVKVAATAWDHGSPGPGVAELSRFNCTVTNLPVLI